MSMDSKLRRAERRQHKQRDHCLANVFDESFDKNKCTIGKKKEKKDD